MRKNTNLHLKIEFSGRKDGDMRDGRTQARFLKQSFGLGEKDMVAAEQVHGATVKVVTPQDRGRRIAKVDALVSRIDGVPLVMGVRVADCVPLLLVDEKAKVIAAVHSGWRGTLASIVPKTVSAMGSLGADIRRIYAHIGPHIKQCCYDVPHERAEVFAYAFQGKPGIVSERHGKHYLSLGRAITHQLLSAGINPSHIRDLSRCTSSHISDYFSFRADSQKSYGEQMGFIGYA